MNMICTEATVELLEKIWDKNIADNPDDPRWLRWKKQFIDDNTSGKAKTFLVLADGEPVGEGTLLFSQECKAVVGRPLLANDKTANINALRIEKAHEGQGHISRLVKMMEAYAKEHGYERLTIGVEAQETRNLAIYLHWGYQEFVMSEMDDDVLVLYYAKNL